MGNTNTNRQEVAKKTIRIQNTTDFFLKFGVYVIFGLVIIIFAFLNPRFFTFPNFLLILQQASPLGIVVVGMTFVLMTAGIDISVGRTMFLVAHFVGYLMLKNVLLTPQLFTGPAGYIITFLICLVFGALIGVVNGLLITKFSIVPFIVTLAVGSINRGIGLIISDSRTASTTLITSFVNSKIFGIPIVLLMFLIFAVLFDHILRRTTFGMHLRAIGNSPEMARKTGVKVNRNIIITYTLCGALAGFAGGLLAGQIGGVSFSFGEGNEFVVISAAVLGGTSLFGGKGSILPGAIIGIVLVTTIMNGLAMINASPYIYTIVRGLIIYIAVLLDSVKYEGELR